MNSTRLRACAALLIGLGFGTAFAQAPNAVSGTCKDGTTFSAPTRRGACSGHGGIATTNPAAPSPGAPASGAPSSAPPAPPPVGTPPMGSPSGPNAGRSTSVPNAPASAGATQVWANTQSKIYHCATDKRNYGNTKQGQFMSEADARAQGYRPARGKSCS